MDEFDDICVEFNQFTFERYNLKDIDAQRLQEKIVQNEYMSEIEELIDLYNEN